MRSCKCEAAPIPFPNLVMAARHRQVYSRMQKHPNCGSPSAVPRKLNHRHRTAAAACYDAKSPCLYRLSGHQLYSRQKLFGFS